MSWKSTIRSIQADERRSQRDAQRRYKELQRQSKEHEKLSALQQARLEVETYENRVEILLSMHKEQGNIWNWEKILEAPPPAEPVRDNHHATEVERRRAAYVPSFFDKLFGKATKQAAIFDAQTQMAQGRDEQEFQEAWRNFQHHWSEWEDEKKLAASVLAGDHDAYARVLRELSPFGELSELGSSLDFRIHTQKLLEAVIQVRGEQTIPSEMKTLTASGKVSSKPMPKARFYEIYQDYVCGCVLRVGREAVALLPVDTVIVTALADVFDSRTGQTAEQPIMSVAIPRAVLSKLNFNLLNPSDAMENFLHRGEFKASRKSGAFAPITPLSPTDVEAQPLVFSAKAKPVAAPLSLAPSVNPFPAKWAEALRRNEIQFGFLRLTANELAELIGKSAQKTFTLPESKAMARAVEAFGYCLEPDPRHGTGNFWGGREVGVFQPSSGSIEDPSESFRGASTLLQLCLLVAAADGTVDRKEVEQFWKFIDGRFQFTPDERQRLIILETLLSRNVAPAKVTLGRLAKGVPPDKQLVIGQFLVDVAAADGVITPDEHNTLKRIFEALGLADETLQTLIRNLPGLGTEVVIRAAQAGSAGEIIPAPDDIQKSSGLKLDMAKVAAISAETHDVIGLLAKAMANAEDNSEATPFRESVTSKPTAVEVPLRHEENAIAASDGKLDGLDVKWQPIVQRLITKESWNRNDFDSLAREYRFMPLSVLDAINEWADQNLGDFLIEGNDPLTVHCSMLKN
jgi:uncharacterized tellurite resistance protein B-like protein